MHRRVGVIVAEIGFAESAGVRVVAITQRNADVRH